MEQALIKDNNDVYNFQVLGITCMDCAAKFEKSVAALPGVIKASLNVITGRLMVQGAADLAAIRLLAREEDYSVEPILTHQKGNISAPSNQALYHALGSGVALLAAFMLERVGAPTVVYLTLYAVAIMVGGWGNFKKAMRALPKLNFNMSVLMSVAIIGAVAIGKYEEGASVAFLYAISEMLEARTMEKARRSIDELMDIAPKTAVVLHEGREINVPTETIVVDDIMVLRPGEKIAMDGIIIRGQSAVNQAAITGESLPIDKMQGDTVYAGTLNTYGALEVRVTKLIQDNTIARIIHLVEEAQGQRAPSQAFVEKFAAIYTPIVMALALVIIVAPPLIGGMPWEPWIYRGLALLVVACPCALVVSTPVAIVSAISAAAKKGVLIKGGVYLEEMASLSAIAFDKTGTLTKGNMAVTDIIPFEQGSEDELLQLAAGLEARSEHPLAVAVVSAASERKLSYEPAKEFAALAGRGASGVINNQIIYIGKIELFTEMGLATEACLQIVERLQQQGKTVMVVGCQARVYGVLAAADQLRDNSADVIRKLKQLGIQHTIMLTGDNKDAGAKMAALTGMDEVHAGLLPQDKVNVMHQLLQQYKKVAMVGDGINDAPVLAAATVGIAMGGAGTDTALETSDVALMADDLSKLPFAITLSRRAITIIKQNITFSLAIKVLAVLAVFPGWLTLWLAILADMGATVIVTLNSIRLLRGNG